MRWKNLDPVKQAKARKWLAVIWLLAGSLYLLAVIADKNNQDRYFHVATALMYFALGAVAIFLVRRSRK